MTDKTGNDRRGDKHRGLRVFVGVLLEPHPSITEPEDRRHASTLSGILLVTAILCLVTIPLILSPSLELTHGVRMGYALTVALGVLLIGVAYGLSRTANVRAATYLGVFVYAALTLAVSVFDSGTTLLFIFPVVGGVLGGAFLSPKEIVGIFVALTLVVGGFALSMPAISLTIASQAIFFFISMGIVISAEALMREQDMRHIRDQADAMEHQANHDSLTRLPNRAAALEALTRADACEPGGARPCVAYVDLIGFKRINDTYGHVAGDEVLREVAQRMAASVRTGDFVARLGGDEFLIIAEDLPDEVAAVTFFERVLETIREPMVLGGYSIVVSADVGIALSDSHGQTPTAILRNADLALYRARRDRTHISVCDESLLHELALSNETEHALRETLARGGDELWLRYQPIVAARTMELVGIEALVSWDRPGHGLLMPDSFIPIAEQSDLIVELDAWVMHEATKQLAEWSAVPPLSDVRISVNVSGRHVLHERLVENVRSALESSGIAPRRLMVEVTETVLVADVDRAAGQLAALRGLGVQCSIDDFGTGFTSIAHLRGLPVSEIKIDRGLVMATPDPGCERLIELVAHLAQHIHAEVVAEGVETDTQLSLLEELGCTALQGYWISRPLDSDSLADWAEREHADSVR